jgi:hypothetical protein
MRYIILKLIHVHVVLELESWVLNNYHIKQYVGYDVVVGIIGGENYQPYR